MAIQVKCSCGKRYRLTDKFAGARVKCKECGESLHVPVIADVTPQNEVGKLKEKPKKEAQHHSSAFIVLAILMVILQGGWLFWLGQIYLVGSGLNYEQGEPIEVTMTRMSVPAVKPLLFLLAGLLVISIISVFLSSRLRDYRNPRLCQALLIFWATWPMSLCFILVAGIPGMSPLMLKFKEIIPLLLLMGTYAVWAMQQMYAIFYAATRMGYQLRSPLGCVAEGYAGTFKYKGCMSRHGFLFFLWQHLILLSCLFAPLGWYIDKTPMLRFGLGRPPSWLVVIALLLLAGSGLPLLSASIRRLRDLSIRWVWIFPAALALVPFFAGKTLVMQLLPISIIVAFVYLIVGALGKQTEVKG